VSEGASTDRSGNGPSPEGEAPRLQDTVERESIRLPLPDKPPPDREPPDAPPEAEPDWLPPEPEAAGEPAARGPAPISGAISAADETDPGPRPELLVGAAFAGGLVLALLLRRLRS
jgi:hypothetical protein